MGYIIASIIRFTIAHIIAHIRGYTIDPTMLVRFMRAPLQLSSVFVIDLHVPSPILLW